MLVYILYAMSFELTITSTINETEKNFQQTEEKKSNRIFSNNFFFHSNYVVYRILANKINIRRRDIILTHLGHKNVDKNGLIKNKTLIFCTYKMFCYVKLKCNMGVCVCNLDIRYIWKGGENIFEKKKRKYKQLLVNQHYIKYIFCIRKISSFFYYIYIR